LNFYKVIQKAKIVCMNAGNVVDDHFLDVRKKVEIGSPATREIDDIVSKDFDRAGVSDRKTCLLKKTSKSWRDGLLPKT